MRRVFGIRPGDEIEITVDGGSIMLRKVEVRCVICDGSDGLQGFKGKQVCSNCRTELQDSSS
jgi:transcriptional pleiotropic regulator of transition state genes